MTVPPSHMINDHTSSILKYVKFLFFLIHSRTSLTFLSPLFLIVLS